MDGRSFRPASADDGRDSARRIGAGGTGWHFQFRNVLRFLRVQCPGIRLRRAAAEPGTALPLLREIQGQGDGNRLSGNWTGWCRVTVVLAFPLAFSVRDVPAQRSISPTTTSHSGVRAAFKRTALYLLIAASMCSIAAVSGTQQNLKLFLSLDQHYSQEAATRILSLVLTFSMVGRLLMGWLADHFSVKYVMLLIYTLVASAIPFLFLAPATVPMYAFAILFGIGLGGDYMIIPLMTAEIFGLQILGTLLGVILTADGVAEAVSPWVVGDLRDISGSYTAGFSLLVAIALLGAGIAMMLPKKAKA